MTNEGARELWHHTCIYHGDQAANITAFGGAAISNGITLERPTGDDQLKAAAAFLHQWGNALSQEVT